MCAKIADLGLAERSYGELLTTEYVQTIQASRMEESTLGRDLRTLTVVLGEFGHRGSGGNLAISFL